MIVPGEFFTDCNRCLKLRQTLGGHKFKDDGQNGGTAHGEIPARNTKARPTFRSMHQSGGDNVRQQYNEMRTAFF